MFCDEISGMTLAFFALVHEVACFKKKIARNKKKEEVGFLSMENFCIVKARDDM